VEVGGPQPRLVLALLLAAAGRAVRTDALIDALWGDQPPASASGTLQSYVSRLRRAFDGDDDASVVHADGSYRLDIDLEQVDAWRFEALAVAGPAHLDAGDLEAARRAFAAAEAVWRGPALAEFAEHEVARNLAVRLDERRIEAIEHRIAAELERVGRLADGWHAAPAPPDALEVGWRRVRAAATAADRDAGALAFVVRVPLDGDRGARAVADQVADLGAIGVDEVILEVGDGLGLDAALARFAAVAEAVEPQTIA
jgi:hypothetical protein